MSVLQHEASAKHSSRKFLELFRFDRFQKPDANFCLKGNLLKTDSILSRLPSKPLAMGGLIKPGPKFYLLIKLSGSKIFEDFRHLRKLGSLDFLRGMLETLHT